MPSPCELKESMMGSFSTLLRSVEICGARLARRRELYRRRASSHASPLLQKTPRMSVGVFQDAVRHGPCQGEANFHHFDLHERGVFFNAIERRDRKLFARLSQRDAQRISQLHAGGDS